MGKVQFVKGPTLSFFINSAHKNYSFVSAFIYGPQGVGKTTYALKTLYYVYKDWDCVLKHTFFDYESLINRLEEAFDKGERIKALLIDDAGLVFIKYLWRSSPSIWFSKLYNLIRSLATGVIFTSVEVTDIIKFIRDKVIYRVSMERVGPNESVATGYKVIITPMLESTVKRIFQDHVSLELPNEVREHYERIRRNVIGNLLSEIKQHRKRPPKIEINPNDILELLKDF